MAPVPQGTFNGKIWRSASSISNRKSHLEPSVPRKNGMLPVLSSKSAPASRKPSLISTAKSKFTLKTDPLNTLSISFDSDGRAVQNVASFKQPLITNVTSAKSRPAEKASLKSQVNRRKSCLPKLKAACVPLSETKVSFKAVSSSSLPNLSTSTSGGRKPKESLPVVSTKTTSGERLTSSNNSVQVQPLSLVNQCDKSEIKNCIDSKPKAGGESKKHVRNKMKTSKSEVSLVEQKKLQWAKERDELNGLWSPWGRQSGPMENRVSPAIPMQASYPSPTNVVTSSYMSNLDNAVSPYSQSYSECYLPPINSAIAQQPRQKAKLWNAEFQPEDYRYENGNTSSSSLSNHRYSLSNVHHHATNIAIAQARKASLPNYMLEGGDGFHHNHAHHVVHNKHNCEGGDAINHQQHAWGALSMDDEAFTSDYYSENNNNPEDSGVGRKPEVILKPTSRERSYQQEITVQKAISIRGDNNTSPKVIVHKIYAQNGEVILEHDGNQEVIVNSMTISGNSNGGNVLQQQYSDTSKSPGGRLPRNHAMRSSLTIGVDAREVDAYNDIARREKQQWLDELDKQREEQRMRKIMEKEERRPRWGERGIGVGHFWEPSEENSNLPAPYSGRSKHSCRGDNGDGSGRGGGDEGYSPIPVQSQTPPAWLERSLTRMQSSKSQPSLHDPDFADSDGMSNDGIYNDNMNAAKASNQLTASGRSLNYSTSDLVAYNSVPGDPKSDRSITRGGQILSDQEKKRLANQEHLEALKKQIEAKQQKLKEEKEQQLQEEKEHEKRMAKQRELEMQRLEREKRGNMPVNGDMPNSVEDSSEPQKGDTSNVVATEMSTSMPYRDPGEEQDIEIVQRQSVLMTRTPTTMDEDEKTNDSSDAIMRPRLSRQDQSIMTDVSDTSYERTLTPSLLRSRSLSVGRSIREFGTQTELSDASSSSGSSCASGKDSDKNRSHNSLLDKKAKEKAEKLERKKPEERPRWNSTPVTKQYVKQSDKDPNYVNRIKRRQERLKRMEEERSFRVDTGTESEDVGIPFHRIRQRRNEPSPQRRVSRGPAPLKATAFQKTESGTRLMTPSSSEAAPPVEEKVEHKPPESRPRVNREESKVGKMMRSRRKGVDTETSSSSCPQSRSVMKNAKSETSLSRQPTAEIIDRNFGSVAGINVLSGTSEESSGFSTPFPPKRDIGSGSTGSGTTGSGVQSPDLTYHTYQANKSTREERKYAKITSGRDTHSMSAVGNSSDVIGVNSEAKITIPSSPHIGFIPQRDFDEMPVKAAQNTIGILPNDAKPFRPPPALKGSPKKRNESKSPTRGRAASNNAQTSVKPQQPRNKSVSPQRKSKSPVKAKNTRNLEKSRTITKSTNKVDHMSIDETQEINLPNIPQQSSRPSSPPVPALLKKMQFGLQPDESGRLSSLPSEFPDILAPLPTIPIGVPTPDPSRLSSAASCFSGASSHGKIDIDIAVSPRNNPEILRLFEAAEEKIKERQLSAIMAGSSGKSDDDSEKSTASFEADIGRISINLEPIMLFPSRHLDINEDEGAQGDAKAPSPRLSNSRSLDISPRPLPTPRDAAMHEAFIASILNSKEVKEQLSARESELSEKGIIEFSIRLPSTSSGEDILDEYQDPLLSERRRNTAQWLYGGQSVPQKQAILTNLTTLKQGIAMQQQSQEWTKVSNSDTE